METRESNLPLGHSITLQPEEELLTLELLAVDL